MKTPQTACLDYVVAVEAVRVQTRIMRNNRCTEESDGMIGVSGYREGAETSCLTDHWTLKNDGNGNTIPGMDYADMCANCKTRLQAFKDRREAKKRLGSCKRSVEVVGRQLLMRETAKEEM